MPQKKRSTLPKKRRKEERPKIAMPIPAVDGPVQPPPARPTLWVVIVIAVFVISVVGLLVFALFKWPTWVHSLAPAASTPQTNNAPPNPVYSYTSVVTPVLQKDHYVGSPVDCTLPMSAVGSVPTSTVPIDFILAVQIPNLASMETSIVEPMIAMFAKHGLKLTITADPSTWKPEAATARTDLAAWSKAGHEIGLLFDPASVLQTDNPTQVPYGSWLLTMHQSQQQLEDLCGCTVTSFVGGDAYNRLMDVSKQLGFTAHSGWVDQATLTIPEALDVVNPWTPSMDGSLAAYTTFDPLAPVVAVPSGVYPASCEQADAGPIYGDDFSYTTKALYESMKAATKGKVNVFRVSTNTLDFVGGPAGPDSVLKGWDDWLTKIVDPLVRKRLLVPSTTSTVATQFENWLEANLRTIPLK